MYSTSDTGYDRERALFAEELFAWLEAAQWPAYEKALKAAGRKNRQQEGTQVRRAPGRHRQDGRTPGPGIGDSDLMKPTKVNSKKQFMESRTSKAAVTEAVNDNQGATTPWPTPSAATDPGSTVSSCRWPTRSTRRRPQTPSTNVRIGVCDLESTRGVSTLRARAFTRVLTHRTED